MRLHMFLSGVLCTMFICNVNLAAIKQETKKAFGFANESFLKNTVDVPHVNQGSGKVHKISENIPHGTREDDKDLNVLLREIFKKIVTNKNNIGPVTGEDVKIDGNGVAYKHPNRIPTQEKRELEKPQYDKNGVAQRVQERIPTTHEKRGENEDSSRLDSIKKSMETGTVSFREITSAVDKIIDKLSKTKSEKKTVTNNENKKYKFEEVEDEVTNKKSNDKSNKLPDYDEFKEKFYKFFLESDAHTNIINTEQKLINTGKDNNQKQHIINTGKDTHHENSVEKDYHSEATNEVEKKRLDGLYEELKEQTKLETKRIEELQRKKRLQNVKRDILDLINGVQNRQTFTYDGEKFGLKKKKAPTIINTGKDNRVKSNNVPAESAAPSKRDSRLDTVELLIKQIRELDENKKREATVDNNNKHDYSKLYKKDDRSNTEQQGQEESARRMEKVFLDAFKRSFHKQQIKKDDAFKKDAAAVFKKDAMVATVKKDSVATVKKEATKVQQEKTLRGMLENLMDELNKPEKTDKRVVARDNNLSSSIASKSTSKRFENELDNIVTTLDNKKQTEWKTTDETTRKALEGFNINKDTLRERKDAKKSDRP